MIDRFACSRRVAAAVAALLSAALLAGCQAQVAAVPASGRVTLDGQPLADAHLSLTPRALDAGDAVVGSYATTDADGRFAARLVTTAAPGAMPGEHLLRITTVRVEDPAREGSPLSAERVPAQYRAGVSLTVPAGGSESLDIALQSSTAATSQ